MPEVIADSTIPVVPRKGSMALFATLQVWGKLSGLRAPKQFLLRMFLNSSRQRFKILRKNEDGERVASSENEILGGCAASPDTLESHVSNSTIRRGKIRLSSLSVGDPPMHNTFG
jgi:hypothetical protein